MASAGRSEPEFGERRVGRESGVLAAEPRQHGLAKDQPGMLEITALADRFHRCVRARDPYLLTPGSGTNSILIIKAPCER